MRCSTGTKAWAGRSGYVWLRNTAPNILSFTSDTNEQWEVAGTRHPNEEWFYWISGSQTYSGETVLMSQYVTIPSDWNSWDVWIWIKGQSTAGSPATNYNTMRLRDGQNTTTGTILDTTGHDLLSANEDGEWSLMAAQFGQTGTGNQYWSITGQCSSGGSNATNIKMFIHAVRVT